MIPLILSLLTSLLRGGERTVVLMENGTIRRKKCASFKQVKAVHAMCAAFDEYKVIGVV